ncbi:hypothetical protein [Lacinutrix sp. 5H-3-7-4]|uniref:hypothetical protein n=1 Tax=Lacinutrix sp. (strain 5H-3-7-4) TaxID=983544 RepID=UPI00020A3BAB|nr:hypothetical protein [Lacinutrix sp. 5H-3-7-4]AEH02729.1 hypothetical protein Lacal_2891 [Lacinutrix sp. 5H-3-7-4]
MNYNIYILIGFIVVPIGIAIAYYKDYKQDKSEFKKSIRTVGKGLLNGIILLLIIGGLKILSEFVIPLNKNHGIEFNTEREKLGIPKIGENWKISDYESGQFEIYWWKPQPRNGHFKKIIEYGLLDSKTETDYYQNEKIKGTFAWSRFDFQDKQFEYFIEKPNENKISISEKGKIKYEKPTETLKVSKTEFEKYIND